jgi:hypothetical protein
MHLRSLLCVSALLICFAGSLVNASAQEFGSTQLIQAAKFLEAKPFDKNAEAIRGLAVRYVIETKDVSVVVCGGDITKPFLDKKNKNSTELIGQYTIGLAAFKLENPSKSNDENATQLAALESVLRTYETMLREKPKSKHALMDEYILKRDKGELKALVDGANCGKGT